MTSTLGLTLRAGASMDAIIQTIIDWLSNHGAQEQAVITQAPVAVGVCFAVIALLLYFGFRFYFGHEIKSRDSVIRLHEERHKLKDEKIAALSVLVPNPQHASPDEIRRDLHAIQSELEERKEREWSRLTDDQKSKLIKYLETIHHPPTIWVIYAPASDCMMLALDFYEVFQKAGWDLPHDAPYWVENVKPGITIQDKTGTTQDALIKAITESTGFQPSAKQRTERDSWGDPVVLMVGLKLQQ